MGGAAFPTKTATSPATVATWFAAIPDRLTMAWGGRGPGGATGTVQGQAAFLANQWNPGNVSFGGFITAPDGTTNTMQLIVEDTSVNANHGITCQQAFSFPDNFVSTTQRFRLAGFFKAGARTRVALFFTNGGVRGGGNPGSTVYTVFDLAGGQIGVAQTITNRVAGVLIQGFGSEIVAFGNGVYRCSMDFNLTFNQTGSTGFQPTVFLDAGSGTGAANFTYTGDGVSGVYGWKMSMMPAAAWSINNNVMFDDFTSLSTIDVNNTGAPGFKWYPTVSWPGFTQGIPPDVTPPSSFSVNGSILTIAAAASLGGLEYSMATAQTSYPVLPGSVGTGWQLPLLFEVNFAVPVNTSPGPNPGTPGASIYWTLPLEFLANASLSPRPNNLNLSREVDMAEFEGPEGYFQATQHFYSPGPPNANFLTLPSGGNANDGTPIWSPFITYTTSPTASVVDPFDGLRYHALTGGNRGNPPHSSPANWGAGAEPGEAPGSYDATAFHTYSTIILPQYNSTPLGPNGSDYIGSIYHFFDGACICPGVVYPLTQFIINPTFSIATAYQGNFFQTTDGFHFILILGSDPFIPMFVDYARVMQ